MCDDLQERFRGYVLGWIAATLAWGIIAVVFWLCGAKLILAP